MWRQAGDPWRPDGPEYLFHYTSRAAAQLILGSGRIEGSQDSPAFLTDQFFASGADAARLLAIPPVGPALATRFGIAPLTKPVEVACRIPIHSLDARALSSAELADPFRDPLSGRLIYAGGGRQYRYFDTISIEGMMWVTLAAP